MREEWYYSEEPIRRKVTPFLLDVLHSIIAAVLSIAIITAAIYAAIRVLRAF